MASRVFIDGHAGTTGLRIREWLADRDDIELLAPEESRRREPEVRTELINRAELAVLCLPEEIARESVGLLRNPDTKILDASTAHRIAESWVYGVPELGPDQRQAIASARLVSNPGCYAIATVLALRPLIDAGLLAADAPLSIHALSGYSGGGREMIGRWEDADRGLLCLSYPAPYALDRAHKHMPEVTRYAGLAREPQFVPAVGAYYCGMRVEIPLHAAALPAGVAGKPIWEVLSERYAEQTFVRVAPIAEPLGSSERSFDPQSCNDTNRLELHVVPHPAGHVLLIALLDNLGKGAAGTAIQNLNLMLGLPESRGLVA